MKKLSLPQLLVLNAYWLGLSFMWNALHPIILPAVLLNYVPDDKKNTSLGLLTFVLENRELEVISLDSLREGQGFGSRLLDQAIAEAHLRDCCRVFLITTNDNLHALGFYQRRGFELVRINRSAVTETRKLKPAIPLIGMNNIPMRDEIELELNLQD